MTPRWDRHDMMARRDRPERALPTLAKLPMLSTEAKEPMLATENADPTEPIDRTDPLEAMDSTESRDAMLQRERGVLPMICCAVEDTHGVWPMTFTHVCSTTHMDDDLA